MEREKLAKILEAAIMAYNMPLTIEKMQQLFDEQEIPTKHDIQAALALLSEQSEDRGVELQEVASGYRFQSKQEFAPWLVKLWEEKPPKYSRATLETLVLIAYRQPITRAEIEEIRGVSVSSHIIKSLQEREWIRLVGHRDVPGKPGLYGTTKKFLDYFNLTSLNELPTLAEVQDLDILGQQLNEQLNLDVDGEQTQAEKQDAADMVSDSEVLVEHQEQAITENDMAVENDTQQEIIADEQHSAEQKEAQVYSESVEEIPSKEKSFLEILDKLGTESANEIMTADDLEHKAVEEDELAPPEPVTDHHPDAIDDVDDEIETQYKQQHLAEAEDT